MVNASFQAGAVCGFQRPGLSESSQCMFTTFEEGLFFFFGTPYLVSGCKPGTSDWSVCSVTLANLSRGIDVRNTRRCTVLRSGILPMNDRFAIIICSFIIMR